MDLMDVKRPRLCDKNLRVSLLLCVRASRRVKAWQVHFLEKEYRFAILGWSRSDVGIRLGTRLSRRNSGYKETWNDDCDDRAA